MSFILDALKKSEVERQRQAIPGLMDSRPLPPRAKFPLWAAALIALLVVNLVILAVVLTRGGARAGAGPSPTPPTATAKAPPAAASPAAAASAPITASQDTPATAAMTAAATRAPAPTGTASASAAPDHFSPMDAAPPRLRARDSACAGLSGGRAPLRPCRREQRGCNSSCRERQPDPVLTDSESRRQRGAALDQRNQRLRPAGAGRICTLDVHVYATQARRAVRLHQHAQIPRGQDARGGPRARAHPPRRRRARLSRLAILVAAPVASRFIVYHGRMRNLLRKIFDADHERARDRAAARAHDLRHLVAGAYGGGMAAPRPHRARYREPGALLAGPRAARRDSCCC